MIKITEPGKAQNEQKIETETVHVNEVVTDWSVTDWSYALAEFSLSRGFLFLDILATFTLQMFFEFDMT